MRKMLSRTLSMLLLAGMLIGFSGCYRLEHVIGKGAESGQVETTRQWYALFGIAPLNDVDIQAMAGDAEDYLVVTEMTFVDGLIRVLTLGLITPETVTVTQ